MRKLLLSGFAMFTTVCMFAQTGAITTPRLLSKTNYKIAESQRTGTAIIPTTRSTASRGSSRTVTTTPIGTAGNAYGSIQAGCNQVSYIGATNQVVFIHRTNKFIFPGDDANNGQYRYDVSRDGGATWSINNGTVNPSGSEAGFACRYPQISVYNPTGNTNPDSSYMTYFGSFHSGGSAADWQGYPVGRARLDNHPSTFTERGYTPNSSNTTISTSFVQSAPGIYWAVDEYSTTADGTDPTGISVYKGTWNTDSNGVVWTALPIITVPLDNNADGARHLNSTCISFDPTGQFGWIAASADVTNDGEGTFDPIFYKTTDGGTTWSSMIRLDLDSVSGITFDPINGPASTTFELGLAVDINGNPHLGALVLPGSTTTPFSIIGNAPDKFLYDITYDPTFSADCQWRAIKIDYVNSLRKELGDVNLDNYIKASRSEDGSKVFFSWCDSDSLLVGANEDNTLPDFKVAGIDVVNLTRTAPKNFTVGDAIWEGDVLWPQTSPTAKFSTGTYNIPTVFAKLNVALSDVDTTYFHYVSNINFTNAEFNQQLDNDAPDLSMIDSSLVWLAVGSGPYADPGAIAFDCYDGNLTDSISVVSTVNTAVAGTYTITYTVSDAAGNTSTVVRTVRVATSPNCAHTVVPSSSVPGRFNFQYSNPGAGATSWTWKYSSSTGSGVTTNGNIVYTYPANGTYEVIFCATNPVGTCCDTTTISIVNISVQDFNLNENVSVYPNPVVDLLNVSIDLNNSTNTSIQLLNVIGEVVYNKNLGIVNGTTNEYINVANLNDGMYILRVQNDNGVATKKITVSKK
jgi:PKD repeat protein